MVRKCCVPGCKSNSRTPSHSFPKNKDKSDAWLNRINLNHLIEAPQEERNKLKICGMHFSEEMIFSDGRYRRLKDDAMPISGIAGAHSVKCSDKEIKGDVFVPPEISSEVLPEIPLEVLSAVPPEIPLEVPSAVLPEIPLEVPSAVPPEIPLEVPSAVLPEVPPEPEEQHAPGDNHTQLRKNKRDYQCIKWHDHRYSAEQKTLAITMYKTRKKRAYTRLQEIFIHIPTKQTLQLMLHKIPISAGLSTFVFQHLKSISLEMSERERICILSWDEASIQPDFTYDSQTDIIFGFSDWGNKRTNQIADHVLVFMLKGLHTGWKIPVSFHFCSNTKAPQLMKCIKEHILKIKKAGFTVVATVCDQAVYNVATIKQLIADANQKRNVSGRKEGQSFQVGKLEVIPLFDPPDLIKGIRNNFIKKDLKIKDKEKESIASWNIIKSAWLIDKKVNTIRPQLQKITKEHIMEKRIKKMPVKYATQILGGSVASCIETLARCKCVLEVEGKKIEVNEKEGIATAETVCFFNDLFDSMNGGDIKENRLRAPTTEYSSHHKFWINAKRQLKKMRFVNSKTHADEDNVPSLKNFIFTINGFEKLWTTLSTEYNFTCLKTRHCNKDSLENFLGQIRSHAYRSSNPTPRQFQQSFTTLLINDMKCVKIGSNCEVTEDVSLSMSLQRCLEENADMCDPNSEEIADEEYDIPADPEVCKKPIVNLLEENLDSIISDIIKQLKYCDKCKNCLKTSDFQIIARQIVSRTNKLLTTRCHCRNILKMCTNHFNDFLLNMDWWTCFDHKNEIVHIIVKILCKKTICWWCQKQNNIYRLIDEDEVQCAREIQNLKQQRKMS